MTTDVSRLNHLVAEFPPLFLADPVSLQARVEYETGCQTVLPCREPESSRRRGGEFGLGEGDAAGGGRGTRFAEGGGGEGTGGARGRGDGVGAAGLRREGFGTGFGFLVSEGRRLACAGLRGGMERGTSSYSWDSPSSHSSSFPSLPPRDARGRLGCPLPPVVLRDRSGYLGTR